MRKRAAIHNLTTLGTGAHTVVLGNGLGTGQTIWRHQVDALSDRYRLVLFDYVGTPGTELSEYLPERYESLYGFADDVVALLTEVEVSGATFLGHSVSAMIGALAAIARPELLTRLVMIAGSPRYINDQGYHGGFSRKEIDSVLTSAISEYHGWITSFSPALVGNADARKITEEVASFLGRIRPDIMHQMLRTTFTSDLRAILPKVTQPTMVIQPSNDMAVPEAVGRYLASHLPNATLREITATGHLPHVTAPEQVTPLILEHLP